MKKEKVFFCIMALLLSLVLPSCSRNKPQEESGGFQQSGVVSDASSAPQQDPNEGKSFQVTYRAGENGGFVKEENTVFYEIGCEGFSYEDNGDQTMDFAFQTDFAGNILATYAMNLDNTGDGITFGNLSVPQEGKYKLSIHYTSDSVGNTQSLYINGEKQQRIVYPRTGVWNAFPDDAWVTQTVFLREGENTVTLQRDDGDIGFVQLAAIKLTDQTIDPAEQTETVEYKYRPAAIPVPEGDAGWCFVKWVKEGSDTAADPANEVIMENTVFTAVFAEDADNNGVPDAEEAVYTVSYEAFEGGILQRGEPALYPMENAQITSDYQNIGVSAYYCEEEDFKKYGYVYNIDAPNDRITLTGITVPEDGEYRLVIPYSSNSNQSTTLTMEINGEVSGKLAFGSTGAWSVFSKNNVLETKVSLKAGENTIAIVRTDSDAGAVMVGDLSLFVNQQAQSFTEAVKNGERPENLPEPLANEGWKFKQWVATESGERAKPDREAVASDLSYTAVFEQQ